MASEVRSGGGQPSQIAREIPTDAPKPAPQILPQQVPGEVAKQAPGPILGRQAPGLYEKEQAKLQQQRPFGKVSTEDAARIAQQAGFFRSRKRSTKGFDIGDSSHTPIPIPDEGDDVEWTSEGLDDAQKHLAYASAQLTEAFKAPESQSLAETILGNSFLPTESGLEKLTFLEGRESQPLALEEVTGNVKNLFQIALPDDVPVGHQLLVTGLVVAGESVWVQVGKGGLSEQKLVRGIQKIAERSNQAVGEAQKMSKGVSRELNLQRTFVFKR